MPRLLYGISPIGLGHATRSLAVIGSLKKAGVDVDVFSGGEAAEFLRDQGLEVADIVADTPPHISDGKMTGASLWYIRSWRGHRKTLPRTRKLFDSLHPDLVVCDEEFSGIVVARERGVRQVFIADELELGFARGALAGRIERRVYMWYRQLQDSVDFLVIPDEGVDQGNRRHVGPITRGSSNGRQETRERYGLPMEGQMVLLSLSGSGLGDYLIRPTLEALRVVATPGAFLVISGNRGPRISFPGVHDLGVTKDNQDLVASADLVVSSAGKSTIDEATASGTPIIAIPIKNHAEQERNAASLGYSYGDLQGLGSLIAKRLGKRKPPVISAGAERAASLILSMLN